MSAPIPTPLVLYVHDDLTDDVRARHGAGSEPFRLARALRELVGDGRRAVVLDFETQIAGLLAGRDHQPFAVTIGIGRAGERVARQLHARTGWFPAIRSVAVAREEDGAGGYRLATETPLAAQLGDLDGRGAVAVVDDTIYSGLTLSAVLGALPAPARRRAQAFCLRAVREGLAAVAALCPVAAGFVADGRRDVDVSFINLSGLVRSGAIRPAGQPPLAFFERPEWMRAWFPDRAEAVIALCRELHGLLAREDEAS